MGGTSSERAVSLSTGRMILSALDPKRYEAVGIDTQQMLAMVAPVWTSAPLLTDAPREAFPVAVAPRESGGEWAREEGGFSGRPDVVFIALHGKGGEDGTIQGLLDMLQIPYTGSGVLASALAMDKAMTKRVLRDAGLPVIPDISVARGETHTEERLIAEVEACLGGFPVFVKPNAEGSTVGCTLVEEPERLLPAIKDALLHDASALVETYVQGMEITASVLDNPRQALPLIEIVPKGTYYDYESKYTEGGSEHIIPARLPESLTRRAQSYALRCHEALGCRGMSRTDMLVQGNEIFILEVNTIPGMTPTSLLPQAAEHAHISFPALLDRLIDCALEAR
jgi:D-alanine-D-alanine ligase